MICPKSSSYNVKESGYELTFTCFPTHADLAFHTACQLRDEKEEPGR